MLVRFRREAEIVAKLRHPNIVEVVDWDNVDGMPYLVMEDLDGEPLKARVQRGPIAWPELALIADQVLAALSVAHRAGVVHRDLKPENIFLMRDDSAKSASSSSTSGSPSCATRRRSRRRTRASSARQRTCRPSKPRAAQT
jgi:serine/threonine-protein kinase